MEGTRTGYRGDEECPRCGSTNIEHEAYLSAVLPDGTRIEVGVGLRYPYMAQVQVRAGVCRQCHLVVYLEAASDVPDRPASATG